MTDEREESPERTERVDRLVGDLLAGRRLAVRPRDAQDRDAILAAARLAGAREVYPRMSPTFRRKLARRLAEGREGTVVSRRTALVAGIGAAVGALTGVGVARVSGVLAPVAAPARGLPYEVVPGVVNPRPGRWFDAGPLENFVEGRPVRFQAGAVGTYLLRRGDSAVGMSSICTHLPCELAWQGSKQLFICPCHNLGFDLEGESTSEGSPLPPLPRLQVKVVGGRVQVLGA